MTDAQFKTYLTNLEKGVTGLASKPAYISDPEVQNILKFLVYEINSTIAAMSVVNSPTSITINNEINVTKVDEKWNYGFYVISDKNDFDIDGEKE